MIDLSYCYFHLLRRILKSSIPKHTVYGNLILNIDDGEIVIKDLILQGKPCMIGRIGSVEMQAINAVASVECGLKTKIEPIYINTIYNNAGFFPKSEKALFNLAELYRESCAELDVAALLMNRDEDYFYHRYGKKVQYVTLNAIEPYYSKFPWTFALKDRKVLVIHPFSKTIQHQYDNKRLNLFDNRDILPDFQLKTLKSVQTVGDNTEGFESWFDALQYMESKINDIDFEIAILGCGAYAFPLAAYIKRLGKQAVIMGGATQLLFGIKGKRWDQHRIISHLYNEHWVRPLEEERPAGASSVESGCYW